MQSSVIYQGEWVETRISRWHCLALYNKYTILLLVPLSDKHLFRRSLRRGFLNDSSIQHRLKTSFFLCYQTDRRTSHWLIGFALEVSMPCSTSLKFPRSNSVVGNTYWTMYNNFASFLFSDCVRLLYISLKYAGTSVASHIRSHIRTSLIPTCTTRFPPQSYPLDMHLPYDSLSSVFNTDVHYTFTSSL